MSQLPSDENLFPETKPTSSSSSSSSRPAPRTKQITNLARIPLPVRKKTFERSSLYTDNTIPAMPAITGIRDWARFQEYQDMLNTRLNEATRKDRERRNAGERVAQNGMTRYDVGSTSQLADLVGFNNVGVKYRPDWTSKAAAEAWVCK
jgi:hypothetical protein